MSMYPFVTDRYRFPWLDECYLILYYDTTTVPGSGGRDHEANKGAFALSFVIQAVGSKPGDWRMVFNLTWETAVGWLRDNDVGYNQTERIPQQGLSDNDGWAASKGTLWLNWVNMVNYNAVAMGSGDVPFAENSVWLETGSSEYPNLVGGVDYELLWNADNQAEVRLVYYRASVALGPHHGGGGCHYDHPHSLDNGAGGESIVERDAPLSLLKKTPSLPAWRTEARPSRVRSTPSRGSTALVVSRRKDRKDKGCIGILMTTALAFIIVVAIFCLLAGGGSP